MRIFILLVFSVLVGCTSSKDLAVNAEKAKKLEQYIENNDFQVIANWAEPLATNGYNALNLLPRGSSANRISLSNSDNHFKKKGDSISLFFPYYGAQQISTGRVLDSGNGGIEFDGVPKDYKQTFNEKKKFYLIEFTFRTGSESYDVTLKLYRNLKAEIFVDSTHRTSILYRGDTQENSPS
ncbi:MAG: DUF4251 domain-containing protein [Flavobacteriaceae bacterium]